MRDRSVDASTRRVLWRAGLLVALLAAAALVVPRAVRWLRHRPPSAPAARSFDDPPTREELGGARDAERKLARAEKVWERSTAIAPSEAAADETGEKVRRFEGFGLSVETRPSGAQVRVNDQDMGRTPLVTSVDCLPGDPVKVEVRKPGYLARERTTTCREDQLVEMTVDLR